MALANLCDVKDYDGLMSPPEMTHVTLRMVKALERSIVGQDYPEGSRKYFRDWTLVASLSRFGQSDRNKKLMCDLGLPRLLHKALNRRSPNPTLVLHALKLVQELDFFIAERIKPRAMPATNETHLLLAKVLTLIVKQNDEYCRKKTILFEENTLFESKYRACMTVEAYLTRIEHFSGCSPECFLIAPVLIGRLEASYGRAVVRSATIHRLLLTAVMLAAKTQDDEFLNNRCFAQIGGVSLEDLNTLELEFIVQLRHNLEVSRDEYETCRQGLNMMSMGAEIYSPRATAISLKTVSEARGGTVIPWPGVASANQLSPNCHHRPNSFLIGLLQ
jgi:hypothetical protein